MSRLLLLLSGVLVGGVVVLVVLVGVKAPALLARESVDRRATVAQIATPAAVAAIEPTSVVTPTATIGAAQSPSPTDVVPRPAVSVPVAGDATAQQGRIIPILPARTQPYANRTLPPTRLVVPSIGVDSRVIPLGTKYDKNGNQVWETPPFAVGHYRGTANPGEPGNVVLGGHISSPSEGSVFKRLPDVEIGDGVIVETSERTFLYQVTDIKVVDPDRVEVMDPTESSIVTLITCVPDGIYTQRLIVRAEAV